MVTSWNQTANYWYSKWRIIYRLRDLDWPSGSVPTSLWNWLIYMRVQYPVWRWTLSKQSVKQKCNYWQRIWNNNNNEANKPEQKEPNQNQNCVRKGKVLLLLLIQCRSHFPGNSVLVLEYSGYLESNSKSIKV